MTNRNLQKMYGLARRWQTIQRRVMRIKPIIIRETSWHEAQLHKLDFLDGPNGTA